FFCPPRVLAAERVQYGGLQTRKAEGGPRVVEVGPRECEGRRVASLRSPLDGGTARGSQSEQTGDLVEGLARRVVDGPSQKLGLDRRLAGVQARVAAGDDQAEAGIDGALARGELAGVEVALEVIDGHERHTKRERQGLGRRQANDQGTDQSGPGRDG